MTIRAKKDDINVLVGAEVSTIKLGYDITLELAYDHGENRTTAYLYIYAPFNLMSKGGKAMIDPDDAKTWPDVLTLMHTKVESIKCTEDEVISLSFSSGQSFTIAPVPRYEAWLLMGRGFWYVAQPN